MTKKSRFKLLSSLSLTTLIAISLTGCAHDLEEYDVTMLDRNRFEADVNESACEHSLAYDSPLSYMPATIYSHLDYHYVFCSARERNEHCDFTPIFEKHDPVIAEGRNRNVVELYNGRMYEQVMMTCSKCHLMVRDAYILVEEVDE